MRCGAGISSQNTSGRSEAVRIDSHGRTELRGPRPGSVSGWVS